MKLNRRKFLKLAAATIVAHLLPACKKDEDEGSSEVRMVNTGLPDGLWDGKVYGGRVVSRNSVHYFGNPGGNPNWLSVEDMEEVKF